jgi:hypothetical protein
MGVRPEVEVPTLHRQLGGVGASCGVGSMGGNAGIGTSGGTCTTSNCNANGVSQNGGPGTAEEPCCCS